MNNIFRTVIMGGALLGVVAVAGAQTTLLDTVGNGTAFGINGSSGGTVLGYDPQSASSAPSDITLSGYAVLPFSLNGSSAAGTYTLGSLSTVIRALGPVANPNAVQNNLYGAILSSPSGTSINANASNLDGSFFQFDITPAASQLNKNEIVQASASSLAAANVTLQAGKTYWLVLAPANHFGTQPGNSVLEYGFAIQGTSSNINNTSTNGGTGLVSAYATETQGMYEAGNLGGSIGGANPGDLLVPTTSGRGQGYYGVTLVSAVAGVPESSTVITALLGLAPVGGLLLRRRRAN